MKFTYIAGLLGAASAVSVEQAPTEDNLVQMEAENLEAECKDFEQMDDDESLLELEGEEERYNRANKYSYKAHYGKTKKQIDAQNHHILSTQKKCLDFVKKYRGHEKVCSWCKRAPAPRIRWRWIPSEKVWYRFYDGKWHYWGPSKNGFTSVGWTWYKGYWHHGGYVFKYVKGMWWRFQGKRWVKYGSRVPTKPGIPRGPRICRPFYVLKKWGFPTSLGQKRLPRCRVGAGKSAQYYMWKDHKACRFLGGKLVYLTHKTCKAGKPHQWKRVIRCVQGPILSGKGLNYKTGRAMKKIVKRSYSRILFNSNSPPKGLRGSNYKRLVKTHKNSRGDVVYTFTKSSSMNWYGNNIKALPDRNFEISFDFRTKQSTAGMFELHYKGYDREIGLKYGKPYVRVWKGRGW